MKKEINKRKQLNELEKSLEKKYAANKENEVYLENEDFADGKLSAYGYNRLKAECNYVSYKEDIEIFVPQKYSQNFKEMLEVMTVKELSYVKKDNRKARIIASALFLLGIICYLLGYYVFNTLPMLDDISIIATWGFIWAAIQKIFFERTHLTGTRLSLLHILSAKITVK